MAVIHDVFGSEAIQYIKTCEFHFKDHRNQKARKLDENSSEHFKLLCDEFLQSKTVDGYNLPKAKIDAFIEECDGSPGGMTGVGLLSAPLPPKMSPDEPVRSRTCQLDPPGSPATFSRSLYTCE